MKYPMEQWEIDLRKRLEEELEDGAYELKGGGFYAITGKQGKIESEVSFIKALKGIISEKTDQSESTDQTINDFADTMKKLKKNNE